MPLVKPRYNKRPNTDFDEQQKMLISMTVRSRWFLCRMAFPFLYQIFLFFPHSIIRLRAPLHLPGPLSVDFRKERVTIFWNRPRRAGIRRPAQRNQQVCALSTPEEKTPTAALRATKRGRKPIANRPYQPEFTGIEAWGIFWFRPRRAGIRRLTGREEKQSSAN